MISKSLRPLSERFPILIEDDRSLSRCRLVNAAASPIATLVDAAGAELLAGRAPICRRFIPSFSPQRSCGLTQWQAEYRIYAINFDKIVGGARSGIYSRSLAVCSSFWLFPAVCVTSICVVPLGTTFQEVANEAQ
jgi:hypothetical protein